MNYDSLLMVKNNHESFRYVFGFNSQRFIIAPGKIGYVPFEAVVRSLGDPRSGPEPQRHVSEQGGVPLFIPSRRQEIERLSALYGAYTDDPTAPSAPTARDGQHGPSLKDRMPQVTVCNMEEGGDPIIFPVDDPLCASYTPIEADASQMAVMTRQLDKMRRQMQAMEAVMSGQAPADLSHPSSTPADATVDEDTPQPLARPRAATQVPKTA